MLALTLFIINWKELEQSEAKNILLSNIKINQTDGKVEKCPCAEKFSGYHLSWFSY